MSSLKEKIQEINTAILENIYPGNHWPLKGGFTQRDNKIRPTGTCNFTAAANCMDYLNVQITQQIKEKFKEYNQTEDILTAYSETEEAYKEFKKYYPQFRPAESEIRPRHFSEMVAWVVNKCTNTNIAKWGMRTFEEIINAVIDKKPVVVSGKFTTFGHFIAIKGITPDKLFFWVDDSWGDFYTKYKNRNGHNLRYNVSHVKNLCWDNQKKHRTIVFEL